MGWGFEGKALYFCVGGRGGAVVLLFVFFQSSGRLAFVKMYSFLQVVVLLKKCSCYVVIHVESDSRCSVSNVY